MRGHWAILSYIGLEFAQLQPQKGNFLLYPYSKEIVLMNCFNELLIKNLELPIKSSRILLVI